MGVAVMARKRKASSLSPEPDEGGPEARSAYTVPAPVRGDPEIEIHEQDSATSAPAQAGSNAATQNRDPAAPAPVTTDQDQASPYRTPSRLSARIQQPITATAASNTPTRAPPQTEAQTTTYQSSPAASTPSSTRSVRFDLSQNTTRRLLTCRRCRGLFHDRPDQVEILRCGHPLCLGCAADVRSGRRIYNARYCPGCSEFLVSVVHSDGDDEDEDESEDENVDENTDDSTEVVEDLEETEDEDDTAS